MNTLEQYLSDHKIDPIRLSLEAGVRYLTIWNAVKEKPIFYHNALKIRVALRRLTGLAYTGPLPTLDEPPIDQIPTIPISKLKGDKNEKGGFPPSRIPAHGSPSTISPSAWMRKRGSGSWEDEHDRKRNTMSHSDGAMTKSASFICSEPSLLKPNHHFSRVS